MTTLNLANIPYEILLQIYVSVDYEDLLRQWQLAESDPALHQILKICHDPYYWQLRALTKLGTPADVFHHRGPIESALSLPEEWAQWRYIELVSRQHVMRGSERFLSIAEAARRAVIQDDWDLVQYFLERRSAYMDRNALSVVLREIFATGNVEMYRKYKTKGYIVDVTSHAIFQLGLGSSMELLDAYNAGTMSPVTPNNENFLEGLIAGGHLGLHEIPSNMKDSFSVVLGLVRRGDVSLLEEASRMGLVDVYPDYLLLDDFLNAVGGSTKEMIAHFLPLFPSGGQRERVMWGYMLQMGDLDTIYGVDQTRLVSFLHDAMVKSPMALELVEHYYPIVSSELTELEEYHIKESPSLALREWWRSKQRPRNVTTG